MTDTTTAALVIYSSASSNAFKTRTTAPPASRTRWRSDPLVKPIRVKYKKGFVDALFSVLSVRVQGRQYEGGDRVCWKLFG